LYKLKGTTDDNLLFKTPFFIWGNDVKQNVIGEVSSNLDILPTIASYLGWIIIPNTI
jgi:arylsulfatase A-like enzyme